MRRLARRITWTTILWVGLLGSMAAAGGAAAYAARNYTASCIGRCGSCGSGCTCSGNPGVSGCRASL